jgi:hypothetical protein
MKAQGPNPWEIEAVDKIVSVPTGMNDRPKNPPKIVKITVID